MTKEECLEALEDSRFLEVVIRGENGNFEYYSNFEDTVTFGLLEQLINEHFELKKRYNLLKESYDGLLGNAVKLQEGICPLCENYECRNPPLKFKELKEGMWVWDDKTKKYKQISIIPNIINKTGHEVNFVYFRGHKNVMLFEEDRFYRREVKEYE